MPSVFVDTNIFLYCFDKSEPAKREVARARIANVGDSLVISTQVLQEFYWNATKKLKLTPVEAKDVIEQMARRKVVQVVPSIVLSSVDTSDQYRISFWDALIVESAAYAKSSKLLSEDLNHGQVIRGMKVENPFV